MTTKIFTIDNIDYTINKLSTTEWHIKNGRKILAKIIQGDSGVSVLRKGLTGQWEGFVYQDTMQVAGAKWLQQHVEVNRMVNNMFTSSKTNVIL